MLVDGPGSTVDVADSTVAHVAHHGVLAHHGGVASLERTTVTDVTRASVDASALAATSESALVVRRVAVVDVGVLGVAATGTVDAASLLMARGRARDRGPATLRARRRGRHNSRRPRSSPWARGSTSTRAVAPGADVTVRRAAALGVHVNGEGASLALSHALVADTSAPDDASGYGVAVGMGGVATLEDALVLRSHDVGVYLLDPGTRATLRRSSVVDVLPNGRERRARVANVQNGASLELERVRLAGGTQVGLHVIVAGASARLVDSVVRGVTETARGFGRRHRHGGRRARRAAEPRRERRHRALDGASASIAACVVRGNRVGMHVQNGARLVDVGTAPDVPRPSEVAVSRDTALEQNGSRVGSGEVPLPGELVPFGVEAR